MMFYLSNVAIAVNISQPSVRIGGGLHALIHIYFLHGGSKSPKPLWDLKTRSVPFRPFCSNSENRYLVGKKSGNGDDGPILNVST